MKIKGNTVGTPIPRSNYNQTDPKKADYLVGRENIVGKDNLASVTEEILAQAKASGEFNGSDGKDGYTPVKGIDYFDGKDGKDGKDGYTPVKGTDYFTEEDKAEIAEQAAGLVEIPEVGGVSDWNDLENRPFYDNEDGTVAKQLDNKYLSILESTYVSILPEQDVIFESPPNYSTPSVSTNLSIDSLSLNIGEVYKVEFDGVVYECTARKTQLLWNRSKTVEHLGNHSVEYPDNGIPFAVVCGEEWDGVTIFLENNEECTKRIRIYQGEEGYKIKPEYLPLYNGEVESV
jgi:hypothetical protein